MSLLEDEGGMEKIPTIPLRATLNQLLVNLEKWSSLHDPQLARDTQ